MPKTNDLHTVELLWTGALTILDGDDREGKQMLPRDLDDDQYYGREHIQAVMSMVRYLLELSLSIVNTLNPLPKKQR